MSTDTYILLFANKSSSTSQQEPGGILLSQSFSPLRFIRVSVSEIPNKPN